MPIPTSTPVPVSGINPWIVAKIFPSAVPDDDGWPWVVVKLDPGIAAALVEDYEDYTLEPAEPPAVPFTLTIAAIAEQEINLPIPVEITIAPDDGEADPPPELPQDGTVMVDLELWQQPSDEFPSPVMVEAFRNLLPTPEITQEFAGVPDAGPYALRVMMYDGEAESQGFNVVEPEPPAPEEPEP